MKVFHCDCCNQLIYFENTSCLNCGAAVAFIPEDFEIHSVNLGSEFQWTSPRDAAYRLCENYSKYNVCNWAVAVDDGSEFCLSCRQNLVIPDLSVPGNTIAWAKFEAAKRRLNYSLLSLGLPLLNRVQDPECGLGYEFKIDLPDAPAMTGHETGIVTINLTEADDAEREKRRVELHEPYRSILGHFRHEVGHYFWDRFFEDDSKVEPFREVFGDEREDYNEALQKHYRNGAPTNWLDHYISSYASAHPWEDWAETWAHYLHLSDTLETASASGLALIPERSDEPQVCFKPVGLRSFDEMMNSWFPLTYVLNNLNRGLGNRDSYPFILSAPVIEKLRFVHQTIEAAGSQQTSK